MTKTVWVTMNGQDCLFEEVISLSGTAKRLVLLFKDGPAEILYDVDRIEVE